jgi:hypothetical protein
MSGSVRGTFATSRVNEKVRGQHEDLAQVLGLLVVGGQGQVGIHDWPIGREVVLFQVDRQVLASRIALELKSVYNVNLWI